MNFVHVVGLSGLHELDYVGVDYVHSLFAGAFHLRDQLRRLFVSLVSLTVFRSHVTFQGLQFLTEFGVKGDHFCVTFELGLLDGLSEDLILGVAQLHQAFCETFTAFHVDAQVKFEFSEGVGVL